MILAYYKGPTDNGRITYWNLLQSGLARGAYSDNGWIHHGLLEMARDYGIQGQCHRHTNIEHVINTIGRNSVCIVSVTRYFLGGQKDDAGNPLPKGGHLVVAYDTVNDDHGITGIVCNHPSSGRPWNKIAWTENSRNGKSPFPGNYIEFFASQGESVRK